MQSKYRVGGALFENRNENGPAFTGFIEIEGVKTYIAGWPKVSAKGVNYFQISEDKKKQEGAKPQRPSFFQKGQKPEPPDDDFDDKIPF